MDKVIKHANIIYVRNIATIGGVETYVYELVKKYKDYDIAVVCKTIAPAQKKRIQEYCKVYIHTNQIIDCKVAIINYDTSIIDYITKDIWKENLKDNDPMGIYQGIHTNYMHPSQGKLPQDSRIKMYLAITEEILRNFSKLSDATNVMLCRNPLELEEDTKPFVIVSPTRLTKEKGDQLMYELSNALDRLGIKFIWFILTTEEYLNGSIFKNPGVVYVKNRLDVSGFLKLADWVVLPSVCEGDSYTIKEALYRNIPIVARHLEYFDEYGIEDGKNALFINEDNVMNVAERMTQPLKFNFKKIEDGYSSILADSKSRYEEEKRMKVEVQCIKAYTSMKPEEDGEKEVKLGKIFTVTRERADELLENPPLVKVLREFKEEKVIKEEPKEVIVPKKDNKKKK